MVSSYLTPASDILFVTTQISINVLVYTGMTWQLRMIGHRALHFLPLLLMTFYCHFIFLGSDILFTDLTDIFIHFTGGMIWKLERLNQTRQWIKYASKITVWTGKLETNIDILFSSNMFWKVLRWNLVSCCFKETLMLTFPVNINGTTLLLFTLINN